MGQRNSDVSKKVSNGVGQEQDKRVRQNNMFLLKNLVVLCYAS